MNIFNVILIQPLANGLMLFYRLLGGNMGLAIIGFSLALRMVLNPLTKPYMQSMKKMKELEPLLTKLKSKHAKDPKKLAEAQSSLYKEKGVNPAGGCLPYILQIVVLIALFNVFTRALAAGPESLSKFNELLYVPLKLAATETLNTHFLYLDITKPDIFRLPGIPFPIPGPLLFISAILQLVASMMMAPVVKVEEKLAKKTKTQTDDIQASMQKSMMYTFPLFTLIFGVSFPSGLALYWMLFSLWQVIQQYQTSGWGGMMPIISKLGHFSKKMVKS